MIDYLPTCKSCREMYGSRTPPETPPCRTCRIDPAPDNVEAMGIFSRCKYQLIIGPSGAIDLNHTPIHQAIELYGAVDKKRCFEKVLTIGRWWLNRLNTKKG